MEGSDEVYLVHSLPLDQQVDFYMERFSEHGEESMSIIFCMLQMPFDRTKLLVMLASCIQELNSGLSLSET